MSHFTDAKKHILLTNKRTIVIGGENKERESWLDDKERASWLDD
jgi:hypothetical protein